MPALGIAVLTVSDTRTAANDTSGDFLCNALVEDGHRLVDRARVADDRSAIEQQLVTWIRQDAVQIILTTGGTGITARDITPDVVDAVIQKRIDGFGELFRALSFAEIGASTIQSRTLAGVADTTLIFCLPGSTGACRLGWEKILRSQLDVSNRPCNFAELLHRL